MNFIKRALCSLWYRKRSCLLLIAVFFVLSLFILTGFSLRDSCRQGAQEMRETIGATVIINNYHTTSSDIFYGADLLTPETIRKIAGHPLVRGQNPFIYSMAMGTEDVKAVVSEVQAEKFGMSQNTWLRVEGTYDLHAVSEFNSGNAALADGRLFTEDDTGVALISSDMARESNIYVGDKVRLAGFYTEERRGEGFNGEDVLVEVVGIYTLNNYIDRTDMAFYNTENLVYVTPDVAYQLNGMENAYSVRFELSDPLQAEKFVEDVQAMGLEGGEDFRFTIDTTQYRSMQSAIDSMTQLSSIMAAAAVITGGVVLVMLLSITLKDRDFELGVLLSMGEDKGKIWAQLFFESLVPVLLGMTAALSCSDAARQLVAGLFSTSMPIRQTGGAVLQMYAAGVVLTLFASGMTAWKLIKYQPKKILMAVE